MNFKKILVVFVAIFSMLLAVSCDMSQFAGGGDNNNIHYNSVTKTCKLSADKLAMADNGSDFLTQGIGHATLLQCTDGDTTNFRLPSGTNITVRYYQINTPESTGSIEKWGKSASIFNATILNAATDFILEATNTPAEHDSYGVRYLGYVWYKDAETNEYYNLNLELVENGYSYNNGINTNKYPYYDYFFKAEQNAKTNAVHLHSTAKDPLYSTEAVPMTIAEFYENVDWFYNKDTGAGSKVQVQAFITDLRIASSGTYTFNIAEYDMETKKMISMNMFCMYANYPQSGMKVGTLYDIIGALGYYSSGYQLSDIKYSDMLVGKKDYSKVVQELYYVIFDSSVVYSTNYSICLYDDLEVVFSNVENNVLTIEATTHKIIGKNIVDEQYTPVLAEDAVTFVIKMDVADNYVNNFTQGVKFSARGLKFDAEQNIITVVDNRDLSIKK